MRALLRHVSWLAAAAACLWGLVTAASAGVGAPPDLRPILPIATSSLPSVFVDAYHQPGLLVYRFDAVIWNDGGALDVYRATPGGPVFQVLWPSGIPSNTSPGAGPGLGGVDRSGAGATMVLTGVWHFHNAARYELLLPGGGSRLIEKVGFCLIDTYNTDFRTQYFSGSGWCQGTYGRMGISPGVGDIYTSRNSAQWIDITGLAPGQYRLRATVNPSNELIESDSPADPSGPPPLDNILEEVRTIPGATAADVTQTVLPNTAATVPLSGSVVGPETKARANESCSIFTMGCYVDALGDGSLAFAIVDPPGHGTLSAITQTGDTAATLVYTPDPGYTGPDSLTYATTDVRNLTSLPATVSLGVGSPPPPPPPQPPVPPQPPNIDPDESEEPEVERRLMVGSRRADLLVGTGAAEIIRALRGADRVRARGGDDVAFGGRGRDLVRGGSGDDTLHGGAGRDDLRGGSGDDTINARDGARDVVRCGPGLDTVLFDRDLDQVDGASCEILEMTHQHDATGTADRVHEVVRLHSGAPELHGLVVTRVVLREVLLAEHPRPDRHA